MALPENLRTRAEHLGVGAPESTTFSPATMRLVRHWIDKCDREHTVCRALIPAIPPDTPVFPTRLLEVGDDSLRIVYTKDIIRHTRLAYIALSHCWGQHPFTTLVTANHDAFLNSVPYDTLTRTFQDVVRFVRAINDIQVGKIRWVWIDSLCIIQDDPADWNRESLQMQDIYSHALFTVAAAHAEDGRGGCETQRELSVLDPLHVHFARPRTWRTRLRSLFRRTRPTGPPDGEYVCVNTAMWGEEVDYSPVAKRAWVAQERFLSRRTVYFGRTQVFFSCPELQACETFPLRCHPCIQVEDIYAGGLVKLWQLSEDLASTLAAQPRDDNSGDRDANLRRLLQNEMLAVWGRLVRSYTGLNISRTSDKLPAISGMAQRFARYLGPDMQYAAGLWEEPSGLLVVPQLLWFTDPPMSRPVGSETPSWSWASVASPVWDPVARFPMTATWLLPGGMMDLGKIEGYLVDFEFVPLASCTDPIELDFEGTSRFGSIKKGVIRLQAQLSLDTLKIHHPNPENPAVLFQDTREGWKGLGAGIFHHKFDTTEVDSDEPVVLTAIQKVFVKDAFVELQGLILRPVSGPNGRYRRVGVFYASAESFWEGLTTPTPDVEAGRLPVWCEEKMDLESPVTYLFSIE